MAPAPIDPDDIAALRRRLAELETGQPASLTGSGALAQGGGDAVGEAGVKTADNFGTIVTGTLIVANYSARGGPLTREQIARQVAGYLGWLRARTQCIELRGIERAGGAPVVLLPLLWLRLGRAPAPGAWLGASLTVVGTALILLR
jgi:hypothetical protein